VIINTDLKEINIVYTKDDEQATSKHDYDLIKVIVKYNKIIDNYLDEGLIKRKLYSEKTLEKNCHHMHNYYINESNDDVEKSLAINFALNKQQIVPPSSRGFQSIGKFNGLSKAEATYSLDLQVIDLHWLFISRQHTNTLRSTKVDSLAFLKENNFRLDDAYAFAQKPWSLKKKAEALLMNNLEEIQSHRIMSTKVANKKRTFTRERATYEKKLLDYCDKPKTKLNYQDIPNYLLVLEALRLASGNDRLAAEVYALLTNQGKLDRDQVSKHAKTINNRKTVLNKVGLKIPKAD